MGGRKRTQPGKAASRPRRKTPARRKKAAARKPRGYRPRRYTAKDRTRAARIVQRLREDYPDAHCALEHRDAYELLTATILSAQCTDERVNMVTPELFHRWPTPAALARAAQTELEDVIRSTGFFRNKAKNLIGMAQRLTEVYGAQVPREMDALLTLPGVARKTANVVRGVVWGLADGVVVDTHVARISRLLGWTKRTDPVHIERDLMALHPSESWIALSHMLIHHGRRTCIARRPRCDECCLRKECPAAP